MLFFPFRNDTALEAHAYHASPSDFQLTTSQTADGRRQRRNSHGYAH
ncbi:MAG: hypothetical protein RH917_03975 [Lacipirellulaceae bacterium]